jgi:ABC-type sugar transport system permease subunit
VPAILLFGLFFLVPLGLIVAYSFWETVDYNVVHHWSLDNYRYFFSVSTYVSTMWADTGLNLKTMFPATGDAAGSDSALLPRPPSARRTLSAGAEGMPYALRMYVSSDSTESLGRFYADWLKKRAWKLIGQKPSHGSSGYMREDGYQVFLTIIEQRGQAYVALTESGNGRTPSVASVVVKE